MATTHNTISNIHNIPQETWRLHLPIHSEFGKPLRQRGIEMAGLVQAGKGYEIARQDPTFHLLVYTKSGAAQIRTPTEEWTCGEGELWFLPAHLPHHYRVTDEWSFWWFHLTPIRRWKHLERGTPLQLLPGHPVRNWEIMQGYCAEHRNKLTDSPEMTRAFATAIGIYIDRRLGACLGSRQDEIAEKLSALWDLISSNLPRQWTPSLLARAAKCSVPQLRRWVDECEGTSPMGMVRRLRMQHAGELLVQSSMSLTEIADETGYATPFAFSKAFKKECSISPKEYRQRGRILCYDESFPVE